MTTIVEIMSTFVFNVVLSDKAGLDFYYYYYYDYYYELPMTLAAVRRYSAA